MNLFQRLQAEHLLIATLVILAALSTSAENILHLVVAPLTAAVLDFLLSWLIDKRKNFPYLGLISGLIIAVVLAPSPVFAAAAAAVAMFSKYFIRLKRRNIFNPAAFAMFVISAFGAAVAAWWAVLHPIVIPLGLLVAWRIRRLETSLSFLVVYFAVVYVIKGIIPFGDYTAYFFAFVMVLEPVTSPFSRKGKLVFGPAVALLATLLPLVLNVPVNIFLGSLLLMNLFTPWLNRLRSIRQQTALSK